ncbi:glycosyltransferase [Rhizobium sp. Root1220]|uniref:glycosyltransferase n=1 Tax=Rhizobium sp. Root1220 TaxID=1736432 RepID=UPI000700E237|nr:glycosyltransferase [Rhizobium sp. Root1220]KQV84249.1 group 1 glycosyl transferase [Rhizobium sp. Root1220]
MRILMACAAFPPFIDGGGPISAMMVAKLLLADGHDLEVINVSGEDKREIYDGVPVRRLPSLNIDWNYRLPRPAWKKFLWHALENFNPRAFVIMRREIRRFKPDIVLTDSIENINVATWAAARSCSVPVCHILRSAFLICWKASMRRGNDNCVRACSSCQTSSYGKKLLSRYVDAVIGETDFIISRHLEHGYFPNASSHKVPGAVPASARREPRSPPSGQMRFGFIGVHDPVKGLDTLALAAHRLVNNSNVGFVIAGHAKSDYSKSLPQKFPKENTRFLGWTKPEEFFPHIDVLVVPSLFREPFGRVVIEAFAQGVPVIGARSGGIPESIEPGTDGYLFDPGDEVALAALIADMAAAPEKIPALSHAALEAARRYEPQKIAAGFNAVFARLKPESAETAGEEISSMQAHG